MTTAEAAFKIIDQASDPIKKIRTAGEQMDTVMKQAGKTLDDIDSPKVTNSIKTTEKNVKGLGNTSTRAGQDIERFTTKTSNNFTKMAATGTAKIEELTRALKHFEHERATAQLDVDIAKAEAKIRLIKQELRTFTTMQAQKELESLGLMATKAASALAGGGPGGGGGGGPPGGLKGGLAGGFFAAGGRAAFMGAAILAALPAVVALTGAVSALIGSLGMAVGGAGALGIGTIGAFIVGIGSIVAVAKPAMNALKEVKDAQDKYNKSVQQYGRDSAQALTAHKTLLAEMRKNPGASDVIRNAGVVSSRWKKATGPAREDFFGILNEGLRTAMDLMPTFGRIANQVLNSLRAGVADLFKQFRGREWQGIFTSLGDTFAKITGPGLSAFGNIALWLGRIAQAASPVVVRMFEKLDDWTNSLARGVANRTRTQQTIEKLVGHLRDWVHMGGAATRLMATFFGAGAQQGQSIVQGITEQFDKWTEWLQQHPGEVQDFFKRTIDASGKLVTALGKIAVALGEIGDAMLPLLNMITSLVNMTGGSLAPLAVIGGARLALGKGFGVGRLFGGAAGGAGGGGIAAGAGAAAASRSMSAGGVRGLASGYRQWRAFGADRGVAATEALAARGLPTGAGALAGRLGMTAARGAAKFALPLTAGLAAWDFLTYRGSAAQRAQNALSGATFGIVHRPKSGVEQQDAGLSAAQTFLGRHPGIGTIQDRMSTLQASLNRRVGTFVGAGTRGPGSAGTQVGTHFALSGGERQRVQAQLDALRPVLHAQVQVKATGQGMKALDDLTQAFETRWHAAGSRAARMGLLHDIEAQMKELGPKGKRALLAGVADWTATLETGNKRQRRAAEATKNQIVSIYRSMGEAVAVVQGKIVALNASNWNQIEKNVTSASNRAAFEAKGAFTDIMNAAARALRLLGFSGGESRTIVEGLTHGGRQGSYAQNAVDMGSANLHGQKQKSARIGDGPGWGDGPAAPRDEFGKHASQAAKMNTASSTGGLMGAKPGLGVYATDAAGYGLHVSSGLRKGAITKSGNTSYHASGDALDVSGPPAAMLAFAQHAAANYGSRLEELIHTPMGFGIKNGKRIKSFGKVIDADHFDHVHIADTAPPGANALLGGGAGAGGVMGGSVAHANIRAPRSRLGGAIGAASDRMYATIAAATEKKLNAVLDASGGVTGGGGGSMSFNQVARLAESVGLPGIAFAQIAKGESGFNPRAVGHDPGGTQGLGLWQITTGFNDDIIKRFGGRQAMFDPHTNALAAKAIYDRAGIHAWYGTKYLTDPTAHFQGDGPGRPGQGAMEWGGWFGRGGSFTAHKPTIIGVGDGGAERITVSPMASNTSGRPVVFEIKIGKIVNYEEGDISDIIKREMDKVADDLDKGVGGDDELS